MSDIITLDITEPNKEYIIKQFNGGRGFINRIESLGLHINQIIEKKAGSFLGGPIVVKTGHLSIAIGRGMARKIAVEKVLK